MEPQQQPRSTQPPPPVASPATPPPPAASPPGGTPAPPAGGSAVVVVICPACNTPRDGDVRYCEECGHDYEGGTAPAQEQSILSGPLLWAFMVFWAVLAVAGLWFLFSVLWAA